MTHLTRLTAGALCCLVALSGSFAEEPKEAPKAAAVKAKVTLSKETTFITEPVREDGYPDYFGALNKRMGEGVTPENNAAVLILKAIGPPDHLRSFADIDHERLADSLKQHKAEYYKLLGIEPLPAEGDYFVDSFDSVNRSRRRPIDPDTDESRRIMSDFYTAMQRPWTRNEFPMVAAWIDVNQKPLQLAREATQRKKCFFPVIPADSEGFLLSAAQRRELRTIESLAECLRARAMLQAGKGKLEDAWSDLLCSHRLARFWDVACFDNSLEPGYVESNTIDADAAMTHFGRPSPKLARQMLADFRALPPFETPLDKGELGDRFVRLDGAISLAREKPKGIGFAIAEAVLGPPMDVDLLFKQTNEWFDREYAALRTVNREERAELLKKLQDEISAIQNEHTLESLQKEWLPRDVVARRFAAEIAGMFQRAGTGLMELNGKMRQARGETVLALAAFRAENKRYPQNLNELVPKYLPSVPADLFAKSPKPIQYRREGDAYALWHAYFGTPDPNGGDAKDGPGEDDIVLRPVPKKEDAN